MVLEVFSHLNDSMVRDNEVGLTPQNPKVLPLKSGILWGSGRQNPPDAGSLL